MIRADLHKKGLGKLLLEKRLALADVLYPGCPVVVSTSQQAYAFFEKYGFETLRTEEDHWAKGLHLYEMRKR
jgi:predicted GNAT family N-acyltransferase